METIDKGMVAVVLTQAFGKNSEGDVINVPEELKDSLIGSGIARDAEPEDISGGNDEVIQAEEDEEEVITASVSELSKKANQAVIDATQRAVEQIAKAHTARPQVTAEVKDTKQGFNSLGDFAKCIIAKTAGDMSAMRKIDGYHRLRQKQFNASNKVTTLMTVGVGADGGNLVPQEWAKQLTERAFKIPNLLSMCTRFPMEHQTLNIPAIDQTSLNSGIQAYYTDENVALTPTKANATTVALTLQKLTVLVNMSDELLRFNGYALETYMMNFVPPRMVAKINTAVVNGTPGNQVNLIGNAATVVVNRATSARISHGDVITMDSRLWSPSKENSCWFINPISKIEINRLAFPDVNGSTPAYMPLAPGNYQRDLAFSPSGTLFGRPVYEIEACPALGSKGDLILADMSQIACGYQEVDGQWTPYLYFDQAVNTFRWLWYHDTVSPITTYYTYEDGHRASHLVVLGASGSSYSN